MLGHKISTVELPGSEQAGAIVEDWYPLGQEHYTTTSLLPVAHTALLLLLLLYGGDEGMDWIYLGLRNTLETDKNPHTRSMLRDRNNTQQFQDGQ